MKEQEPMDESFEKELIKAIKDSLNKSVIKIKHKKSDKINEEFKKIASKINKTVEKALDMYEDRMHYSRNKAEREKTIKDVDVLLREG